MSMQTALDELRESAAALDQAVSELVMIVHEDRPARSEIAVIDHLAETVSELQAVAVLANQRVGTITERRRLAGRLWAVDEAVASCSTAYWRELRSFEPVRELRRTAQARDLEWRTWQRSLELSTLRCEAPLERTTQAVRSAWQEIGELLDCMPSGSTEHAPPSTNPVEESSMSTRRSS